MKGVFVIGVFGEISSTFILNSFIGNLEMMEIQRNLPIEFVMTKNNNTMYLDYSNYMKNDFKIIIARQGGFIDMAINTCNKSQDIIQKLPKFWKNYQWSNKDNSKEIIEIHENNKNFCSSCHYIIALRVSYTSRFSIFVSVKGEYLYLQNGKILFDYVEKNSSNLYRYIL